MYVRMPNVLKSTGSRSEAGQFKQNTGVPAKYAPHLRHRLPVKQPWGAVTDEFQTVHGWHAFAGFLRRFYYLLCHLPTKIASLTTTSSRFPRND